ncbi:MAG: hypothetical protein WBN77_17140 [Desulfobacterales bacterium]
MSYDALLITVSNMKNRSRISSLGYALGYLGGGTLFLCNVLMSLHPHWFGLSSPAEAIKTYISHLAYIEYINLAMNTISNMNNKINLNEVQSIFS